MARQIPEEREGKKLEKVPLRLKTAGNLLKIRGGFGKKKNAGNNSRIPEGPRIFR